MIGRTEWRMLHAVGPFPITWTVASTDPAVLAAIEAAAAAADVVLERVDDDPRFGEELGAPEAAALAVVLKALVLRAGGELEIATAELHAAERTLVKTYADPEWLYLEIVDGEPPPAPVEAAE